MPLPGAIFDAFSAASMPAPSATIPARHPAKHPQAWGVEATQFFASALFAKFGCPRGNACGFCHYERHDHVPKLDKHQRVLVEVMPKSDLLSLVAKLLRDRAQRDGQDVRMLLAAPWNPSDAQC